LSKLTIRRPEKLLITAALLVSIIHGTVKKVDKTTKTIGDTTVKGTKEGFDGLKEGTEVVARTTGKGVDETGLESAQSARTA
jgi:hypothetical protein